MYANGVGKAAGLFGGGADALDRREPSFQTLQALVHAILHLVHILTQPDDESERKHGEDERQNDETGQFFHHTAMLPDIWRHLNPGGYGR